MALLVCSVVLAVFLTMIRDYFTETDTEDIASRYREKVSGLQNECARKDAESCTIRGRDYRAGLRKLQKDSEKGLEYAVKGCEYGSGTGGVVAGVISMDDKAGGPGPGVFFEKACDMNLPSAISELCTRKDRAFPGTARPPDGIMIVSAVQEMLRAVMPRGCSVMRSVSRTSPDGLRGCAARAAKPGLRLPAVF